MFDKRSIVVSSHKLGPLQLLLINPSQSAVLLPKDDFTAGLLATIRANEIILFNLLPHRPAASTQNNV